MSVRSAGGVPGAAGASLVLPVCEVLPRSAFGAFCTDRKMEEVVRERSRCIWGAVCYGTERVHKAGGQWRDAGVHKTTREHSSGLDGARQRNHHCWNVKRGHCPTSFLTSFLPPLPRNRELGKQVQAPLQKPPLPLFQQVAVHTCLHDPGVLTGSCNNRPRNTAVHPTQPATTKHTPPPVPMCLQL